MRKVELLTANREFVTCVQILTTEDDAYEIIIWGTRVFKKASFSVDRYIEVTACVVLNEVERGPQCKDSIRDGDYIRQCELFVDHSGGHFYEVVTSQNADRLRIPPAVEPPPVDRNSITTLHGTPVDALREEQAKQTTGMHNDYIVLSEEERAKGFVRPVRVSYKHVGIPGPKYSLRDLTEEEKERYSKFEYVKFEAYPEGSAMSGRFWTQKQLDSVNKGCGGVTTMGDALAETYARDPHFYGATYCAICGKHLPVGEHGEFVWFETNDRVGT